MAESHKRRCVTLSLENALTPDIEQKTLIAATFDRLLELCRKDENAKETVEFLRNLSFFYAMTVESHNKLAHMAVNTPNHKKVDIDNYFLLLMDEGTEYTTDKVVGFVSYHKSGTRITISQCFVEIEKRRQKLGSTMIKTLRDRHLGDPSTGITTMNVTVKPSIDIISFFVRLGFGLQAYLPVETVKLFKEKMIKKNDVESIIVDNEKIYAGARNPDGSFRLIRYANYCIVCKNVSLETSKCVNCHRTSYCSRACQMVDWPSHKFTCSLKL